MSRYKVGDNVKVRTDLIIGQSYNIVTYNPVKDKFKGKIVTISNVINTSIMDEGIEEYYYEIKDTGTILCWSAEMLESPIKLTKKQRSSKIKDIIKEINGNKDFKKCFEDIHKEVESWDDFKLSNWK